jgi:FKBP-type peptidyl-prolyl cis-trans isomerase
MKIRNLLFIITGVAIILSSCDQKINENVKLNSEIDTLSFYIGVDLGSNLKKASVEEVNYDLFINGLIAGFENKDIKVEKEEIKPFLNKFFADKKIKRNAKNLEDGIAFLEENKNREGVITTESGLQYEIITEGAGESPGPKDIVKCNYQGTFIDGTVFDSTVKKGVPMEFGLDRVIPGWSEGIQLMKAGAKYKFYIPAELAYGKRGSRDTIEPNMVLIFEVELLEIKVPEQKEN